jgi:hypothetical protein
MKSSKPRKEELFWFSAENNGDNYNKISEFRVFQKFSDNPICFGCTNGFGVDQAMVWRPKLTRGLHIPIITLRIPAPNSYNLDHVPNNLTCRKHSSKKEAELRC